MICRVLFFFKQKTAYEMRISDWSSDVCSSDLRKAYLDYIAKTLELTGVSAAEAKTQADQVMAFETRLAAASLAPVELRTPANQYHFVSVAEADKITPQDRKRVGEGKRVYIRVNLGGRGIINQKKKKTH